MALSGGAYGASEFKLAIVVESVIGTAVVASMQYVNADSLVLPELDPLLVHEIRSGTGRTAKAADVLEQSSEDPNLDRFPAWKLDNANS